MQTESAADMLAGVHDTMRQALAPLFDVQAQRKAAYLRQLRAHDWSSQFSDDPNVALIGRSSLRLLRDLQREIDPDYEMWNALCPPQCRGGREYA